MMITENIVGKFPISKPVIGLLALEKLFTNAPTKSILEYRKKINEEL